MEKKYRDINDGRIKTKEEWIDESRLIGVGITKKMTRKLATKYVNDDIRMGILQEVKDGSNC